MTERDRVVLFGDLTSDYVAGLRSLVATKTNPLLTSLFERVAFVLREEIATLPALERAKFPGFITFQELLTRVQQIPSTHPAFEIALACTYQLACVTSYFTAPGREYPSAPSTRLVGLCTGLLSAVALSCSRSITDLVPLAVHTVWVAFRAGLCVAEVRENLQPQTSPPSAWSVVFPPTTATYISTNANAGLTLSGPPTTLQELLMSGYLPSSRTLSIPIYAPYHAPHLYGPRDIQHILGAKTLSTDFRCCTPKFLVLSSVTGEAIAADTFDALLEAALNEILRQPLRLDRVVTSLGQSLRDSGRGCTLFPIATLVAQSFAVTLQKEGQFDVAVDPSMNFSAAVMDHSASTTGKISDAKLAIIGYSGHVARITPGNRWDVRTHVDPTLKRKNTMGTPYGCWLKEPGLFDASFFMISPREAPQVDPAQRLSLMTAYEAMEFAGFVPGSTPSTQSDRIGVFYGTTSNDWGEMNSSQDVDT
ncbi:ketoacyl-synt-domain-containing protein [Aspergillus ibericus CBS 121593]|uniref:Ketoacyl-synt-domain-containing protein n=1 Tax=Aspergillus ibericus CBS 121593 TaxID=1448316 RepID=A0A395H9V9_9EURO|nr:ketoacyl-synt-domain-containing protein [Aspergillus ibericus CBS 121593]RAL03688.1 ketoacyl-synt-domain-containing protein [Aspergillus ibericus CBS 121593]